MRFVQLSSIFSATLMAGALLTLPAVAPSVAPVATAYDCPDVEVIFARGTSEPPGVGRVGRALIDSLRQQTSKKIDEYAVNYPAGRLQLGGGDGANDVIRRVKAAAEVCPNTQLVLGGYSQGASVIDIVTGTQVGGITWGNQLPPDLANQVVAVVAFGNPAVRTGGPISVQSALFGSKALDLCNPGDPICHEGPGNEWTDHTDGYIPALTSQAANFVAGRLRAAGPAPTLEP
ncbi:MULTISPECIES: cutinase family protein [Mycolicibacter]|uniref:Cutinase n=1 Tax=Mycolicibacter virginiensis TaxID=1795032 RepID=A0A9X7IRT5_9MYCO|nr:cutinase family protein [Mycolicibacter virginiensis]OBG37078.1 cutinase [Mycolicibacter heraklionensis]OBJ31223.1 cutinase [Mycolicibacter heraklionensis]PQM54095.1 cutinase family protein [Mycolicibacter virginiensis]ULP46797.1 cutinase family protein [Mycolicibacter virginiensis]